MDDGGTRQKIKENNEEDNVEKKQAAAETKKKLNTVRITERANVKALA